MYFVNYSNVNHIHYYSIKLDVAPSYVFFFNFTSVYATYRYVKFAYEQTIEVVGSISSTLIILKVDYVWDGSTRPREENWVAT